MDLTPSGAGLGKTPTHGIRRVDPPTTKGLALKEQAKLPIERLGQAGWAAPALIDDKLALLLGRPPVEG